MTRFVLYADEWGIYLGSFWGLGFWSKLDPCGQPAAVTFASPDEGLGFAATWDGMPPADLRAVAVEVADGPPIGPDEPVYANVTECMAAGLPAWDHQTEANRP